MALTGSNGKTTVKEMLASILAAHCGARAPVLATEGNLNNDIGMPLTLLRLREHHRFAVIEMGMNHAGEIDYLTRIAQPTVAVVNNAQRAHVGILGSVEAIAHAKGEIYAGLGADGIAVINDDDAFAPYWRSLNAGRRIVSFGFREGATVRATPAGAHVRFITPVGMFPVAMQVRGEHNVRNAMAACAAAYALEIPISAMHDGLASFVGVPGRQQRRRGRAGGVVIDDSYNANPESMKAAAVLAEEPGRKVFVMGDMGELGEEADAMHAEVGSFAKGSGIDALMALGEASRHAVQAFGHGAMHFRGRDRLPREGGGPRSRVGRGDPRVKGLALHADGARRRRARRYGRRPCCMSWRNGSRSTSRSAPSTSSPTSRCAWCWRRSPRSRSRSSSARR